ncbi:hypothetical protein BN12_10070 [Nostocoides japonicum T1-X7]|uniref:TrwC relaxase domain-containing protein n=1 Tax=Nostocoides japonicum T1-X7 TaxID=1194083 RepID=A0A077LSL1_9MICO|nr:relaxase domain-containing protein [Tetrasphaera japonica]CCH75923.1 hypothetical protein BN12_10070 [Tetrasphaera japonica T1-X7]
MRNDSTNCSTFVERTWSAGTTRCSVIGFDLTFSAPTSVSVARALADATLQARIHVAHR